MIYYSITLLSYDLLMFAETHVYFSKLDGRK